MKNIQWEQKKFWINLNTFFSTGGSSWWWCSSPWINMMLIQLYNIIMIIILNKIFKSFLIILVMLTFNYIHKINGDPWWWRWTFMNQIFLFLSVLLQETQVIQEFTMMMINNLQENKREKSDCPIRDSRRYFLTEVHGNPHEN